MTREEAIQVYKDIINPKIREAFEVFAPELAESEDERVINCIQLSLTDVAEQRFTDFGTTLKDCLAYLEKQKEQPKEELGKYSEVENLTYRLKWVMQDYYKAGKDDEEREHRFKCYKLFWDSLEDANFFEQKEQKPAEWSEGDERILADIEWLIDNYNWAQEDKAVHKSLLKSLRPHWKPSEEQMEELKAVVDEQFDVDGGPLWDLYNDLKKL